MNEIKTAQTFTVPGYVVFFSDNRNPNRGGTALLVRNYLEKYITWIDTSADGQIWLKLSLLPGIIIGGCYIPPVDSPYYDIRIFADIESRILSNNDCKPIIIGDLNARCATAVASLTETIQLHKLSHYRPSKDKIAGANQNGRHVIQLCEDCELLVLNNLIYGERTFDGNLTFRRKNVWISEVDLCLIAPTLIDAITEFSINNDISLPSDHAPISISIDVACLSTFRLESLLHRASSLGDHAVLHTKHSQRRMTNRPIRFEDIDIDQLRNNLQTTDPPLIQADLDSNVKVLANTLYACAKQSRKKERGEADPNTTGQSHRWRYILNNRDEKALWKAINWKGEVDMKSLATPSDEEFQNHLEKLYNPDGLEQIDMSDIQTDVTIPVLDGPIDPTEVESVLNKNIKPNKGCGPDGVPPGLLSYLPVTWILTLTTIFNFVFQNGFPHSWAYAKMVMLFKKGQRELCDNYRGISMTNCLAKVYDYVLYRRLSLWFTPSREQAGAQRGRGCTEHIISLRLIMDYCVTKKCKLYVVYIDFSKAYNRIPRDRIMKTLKRLGCGAVMLSALISMYRVSYSLLGVAIITAIIGVRQGAPTSCFLFTCFVDDLIKMIKDQCGMDGFLTWLHTLMLMDDTVILATTREQCVKKMECVLNFCDASGMMLNDDKTKFMVVNGTPEDKLALEVPHNDKIYTFEWTNSYTYLGSIFTSDGKILSAVKAHSKDKYKHFLKFVSFTNKNPEFPFVVKHKVLSSAFMASIFYGCESWMTNNVSDMNKLYISSIKVLLGVRQTTANDSCLLELGYPPLKYWIKQRQLNFLKSVISQRQELDNDPLMFALHLIQDSGSQSARYIDELLADEDYYTKGVEQLKETVRNSAKSKIVVYRQMNPELNVHEIYKQLNPIPEHQRCHFTRLRVVSHNLRIETGRWARQDRENRLCSCGEIQTEEHVIKSCVNTLTIREKYNIMTFAIPDIFEHNDSFMICKAISEILSLSYNS